MTVTALATSVGLAQSTPAAAAGREPRLSAVIDGRTVGRAAVLRWEAGRIQVAAERLSHHLPGALLAEISVLLRRTPADVEHVARDRALLADVKLRMGEDRIRDLLAPDLAVSGPASTLAASLGRWSVSAIELTSSRGSAAGFARWFTARGDRNDERTLLIACPDHYLIRNPRPGVQEVVEVTGGAVLGSRFVIEYDDATGLPIAKDPRYPVRLAGWARTDQGTAIGGVRHQFRDRPGGGFSARLAVAFPATLPPWMISQHRWHLATEFSNWISAYVAAT